MDNSIIKNLINHAIKARNNAYVPYSSFKVGAAILTKCGTTFSGCNIENAAFTPGNCAERTAIFSAIAAGYRDFSIIAIVGGKNELISDCFPCGVCRQVLTEFCPPSFEIIIATSPTDYKIFTLKELLPHSFDNSSLNH